jgi:lipopolysaccharide transport system permease protein
MTDLTSINAVKDSPKVYVRKIWKYRSLIFTFAKRDLKIKYAQTFFGVFWVVLQPIPSVIIFTFFFGKLIKVDTGILPYSIFALVGMMAWNYFIGLYSEIGNSMMESQHILKKIYFPKIILPLSKILSVGADFFISLFVVIAAALLYGIFPGFSIVFFPLFVILNIIIAFTIGIWMSALTFRYRDFQHVVPYVINFSIWLTPVFYPATILPPRFADLMYLNPMAFVLAGYRFALTGDKIPSPQFLISIIPVFIFLLAGLLYFRTVEDKIAEVV